MINPRLLKVGYEKMKSRYGSEKAYIAIVGRGCRRGMSYLKFKTASEAEAYALKVHRRWLIEYDRTIEFHATGKVKTEEVAIDPDYAAVIAPYWLYEAKKQREEWKPVYGQVPPIEYMENAKKANAMLTAALAEYKELEKS